jgi:uncharacterized SAM-binding protein YcdF (DUF218 family)
MFVLKKMLTPFLVPPGIFIVLLILSGLWFLFARKELRAAVVMFIVSCLMWGVSIPPVSDFASEILESDYRVPTGESGDVIVLIGGGALFDKFVSAARLQKRLKIPLIVSSGRVFENEPPQAPFYKGFLVEFGIPAHKILVEDKSRDTLENAKYTKRICEELGYEKPILLAYRYQMKRAIVSFQKTGLDVIPYPADIELTENRSYMWKDYLPGSFERISTAIHEYLGLLFYRVAY